MVIGRRSDNYLVTHDKKKILFSSIETQSETFENIYQIQFLQQEPGKVEVNLIKSGQINEAGLKSIEQDLNSQVQGSILFRVNVVRDLIRNKRGKVKGLVQNLDLSKLNF